MIRSLGGWGTGLWDEKMHEKRKELSSLRLSIYVIPSSNPANGIKAFKGTKGHQFHQIGANHSRSSILDFIGNGSRQFSHVSIKTQMSMGYRTGGS